MKDLKLNNQDDIARHLSELIDECEQYNDEQNIDRDIAIEYYNGEMRDLVAQAGRSKVVSRDVRSTIKKLMPSIMRTLLSNDRLVHYEPVGPQDEEHAQQASDYINYVVVPHSGAEQAIYDSIFDALLIKTGILKWTAYKRRQVRVYEYTGQPESSLLGLEEEEGIEILDHTVVKKDGEGNGEVHELHDFKVRRIEEDIDIRLESVSRRAFLIDPSADSIEDSSIVAQRIIMTRSQLVSQGFDKDAINEIVIYDGSSDDSESPTLFADADRDIISDKTRAMQEVLVYEIYTKLDLDDDGIVELYKFIFAYGGDGVKNVPVILSQEVVDEVPFAAVVGEREAHLFEGHSIAEDMIDIQRIKTALLRETLDNIYWQNKKQPAIDPSKLTESGLDAVYNPAFGKPITLRTGSNVNEAIQWINVPFMADKSFAMMGYLDDLARERTGVSDQSGGLPAESFQNMSATSANLIAQSGIAQAEMIIRSLARGGIRKAFKGLLKLVIAHADQPRTIRLKGKWANYDPRHWNVDMDCVVNVGLGAGSRERDLSVLQMVLSMQKELIGAIGHNNPFVKPEQLYNVLEKITETAGFPSASPYFTRPDVVSVDSLVNDNGVSPDERKLEAQIALEKYKAEAKIAIEQEQANADIRVKESEMQKNMEFLMFKAEQDRNIAMMRHELDLVKHRDKIQLDREKSGLPVGKSKKSL